MPDFDVELNILDSVGTLVLALENDAAGYAVLDGGMPDEDRRWKGGEFTSPWADGASDGLMTLDRTEVDILLEVFGSSWAQVETRHAALMASTMATTWIVEQVIAGVSKKRRAGPVQVTNAPVTTEDMHNLRRYVVLSFKVQPTITITGL